MLDMEGSTLVFRVENELTIYQVEELNKQLCVSFGNAEAMVVDMSRADKIDTAGFQLLVSLKKSCESMNKNFEITGCGGSAQNFMELFGFDWKVAQ
jgi:anti-anti-sigma regulatory factor